MLVHIIQYNFMTDF